MSIQKKLVFTLVFTILAFAVVLSWFSYNRNVAAVEQRVLKEQQQALSKVVGMLEVTDGIMSERVVSSMKLLKERGMALGAAELGETISVNGTRANDLYLGNMALANNFALVDRLTEVMGGTATIFSKQGDDFIRISTNVMKEGKRAIGTRLAPGGKAMAAIRQGKAYYGEVDILGKPYLTAYEPLVNARGEVIGIWYVGYSADLKSLAAALADLSILDKGFVALLDGKGAVRLHTQSVNTDTIEQALAGESGWQIRTEAFAPWGYGIALGTDTRETAAMVRAAVMEGLAGLLGLLVVLGVVVFTMIQKVVMRPLLHRIRTIQEMADGEGDLTRRFNSGRDDEFGTMANEFDRLLDRLQATMKSVASESAKVRQVTAKLGGMADSLNANQLEQADQTKNVASAAHELSMTASEVAGTTGRAQDTTSMALKQVQEGATLLQTACERIQSQASSIEESERAVEQLAADSASISTVLDVIRNIAEQTNLLALNAAIEAARAGEQGRGFAVVADEVRSLASRTQQSTEEINDMVAKLQKQGQHATELMQTNRAESSENASMTAQVSNTFAQVVDAMASLSHANAEIANSTREQGQVTESMSQNIESISHASDRNSQLAQDTQAACEELSSVVRLLESQIGQYKLN